MISIRLFQPDDFPAVQSIYQQGLDTGIASFETTAPDWRTWDQKFLPNCRLVALAGEHVAGWVALTPFSKRAVYRGVAELSLYVHEAHRSRGVGSILLEQLIPLSERHGFWTLQAAIFPQNRASIQLHKRMGFREVGFRQMIAQRDGQWYDNVLLERRSSIR